jgi:hypothetical protein
VEPAISRATLRIGAGDLDRRDRFQAAQGVLLLTLTGTKPPQPPGAGAEGGG